LFQSQIFMKLLTFSRRLPTHYILQLNNSVEIGPP